MLGSSEIKLHFINGAVYIPGYDSKFLDENDFDIISEDILTFREKFNIPIVLMGDCNSHTGNLGDGFISDSFSVTSRVNKDQKIDTYGRKLVTMCKDLNLKIVNGCFGSDSATGDFTCHKKKP